MAAIGSIHWGIGCPWATILLWNTAKTSTNKWRVLSRFKTKIGIKRPNYKYLTNHLTHTHIHTHSETEIYSHTDLHTPHIYTYKHIIYIQIHIPHTRTHTLIHIHSHTQIYLHMLMYTDIHTPHTHKHLYTCRYTTHTDTHTHLHTLKHRYILI